MDKCLIFIKNILKGKFDNCMNKKLTNIDDIITQEFSKLIIESQKYTNICLKDNQHESADKIYPTSNLYKGHGPYLKYLDQTVRCYLASNDSKPEHYWGFNHPLVLKHNISLNYDNSMSCDEIDLKDLFKNELKDFVYFQPINLNNHKRIINADLSNSLDNITNSSILLNIDQSDYENSLSNLIDILDKLKKNANKIYINESSIFGTIPDISLTKCYKITHLIDGIYLGHQYFCSGLLLKEKDSTFEDSNSFIVNRLFLKKSLNLLLNTSIVGKNGKIKQIESVLKNYFSKYNFINIFGLTMTINKSLSSQDFFDKGIQVFKDEKTKNIKLYFPVSIKKEELNSVCNVINKVINV